MFLLLHRRVISEQKMKRRIGEQLNPKYPGGVEVQKEKLQAEGHTIIQKGRKNIRYYIQNYEGALYSLE